jgi:dTDP-4-dehydrorhamnose 3,5-epimerase-like enzyme
MLVTILTPDFIHTDERGTLTQLVREGYLQINVISSKSGVSRGGHYHTKCNEAFYVVTGRLSLTLSKDGVTESYEFAEGAMFMIAPYVVHSFVFIEDTILIGMYDKGVENEDGTKDIITA